MTRTFIAIELNDETRAYLGQELQRLAEALPQIKWVDPANFHVTLAFLGKLDDEHLALATEAAQEIANQQRRFTLHLARLGMFDPEREVRVLWQGISGNRVRLLKLQAALAAALTSRGFPAEKRPFRPHLTLARLKEPLIERERAALLRLIPGTPSAPAIRVTQISVMKSEKSEPKGKGRVYTCLQACPFGK
jgi:2'-5' RNA ligase